MSQSVDTRLRAIEFMLAHLISKTRSADDIKTDSQELEDIVSQKQSWKLMLDIPPSQADEVLEAAIDLLGDALFQSGDDRKV